MRIKNFSCGPFATNTYVISGESSSLATIIDAAPKSFDPISSYLKDNALVPFQIILTHSHWDHIAEASTLKEKYMIPILIHSLDTPNLVNPGTDGLPCWISIEGTQPDRLLEEGDFVRMADLAFEVIHTPGHTPGGICLYEKKQGVLFSGDTLFKGTIGNLSFPTAQPEKMWQSLDKLAKLPSDTKVFPGHGPQTTIGEEKWLSNARNIF